MDEQQDGNSKENNDRDLPEHVSGLNLVGGVGRVLGVDGTEDTHDNGTSEDQAHEVSVSRHNTQRVAIVSARCLISELNSQ